MSARQTPPSRGDSELPWKFPLTKKPRRTKKDGTPRKPRRGWGPYRSVPNERAVVFHLQLDVQHLQQEVHNFTLVREILKSKSLILRHSPEGSLCRLVNEYFRVFRKGVALQEPGRKKLVDARYRYQRAFMFSVMDEHVDLGNGIHGSDIMMEQMARYSLFLRFICMEGKVESIVAAEDTVMVTHKGTLQFQVLRSSIEMIFPHILGNAWLVSQLVGQLVVAPGRSTFHFNAAGKCFRYDVDMDFVAAFANVVKDPRLVDELLGQALISENALIGVIDEEPTLSTCVSDDGLPWEDCKSKEGEEKAPATPRVDACIIKRVGCCRRSEKQNEQIVAKPTSCATACSAREFCQQVVENIVDGYFYAFAEGYQEDVQLPSEVSQLEFLLQRFASQMQAGVETPVNCVKKRWRVLSECFEVLSFQQKGVAQTECDKNCNLCLVKSSAGYILRITVYTIQSVFPHLVSNMPLLDILVGKVIVVPSQISFTVEKNTGRISRVSESMDFAAAIAELLPDRQDLSLVVSQALLVRDGVDCGRFEQRNEPNRARKGHHEDLLTASHTMSITDILN
ncbi:WD repeat-containing protein 60 [Phytophthora pseudosyringae]|uniref:WD repeat-containing protein 60 n=1 Tax=Phytophthora pseudosyringae TaxID=221518 RepID=A0A8T1WBJ8_9STRA|nr:WD repeat-containing protein 60 [Phytophthora pseudosyringae]